MSELDEEESQCPVCRADYCTKHLVIRFVDGHADGGYLESDWRSAARALKLRLVQAWLEGKKRVDGPGRLTRLLNWFSDLDRESVVQEATGSSADDAVADWSEEVYDCLGLDDELQSEIEEIMLEVIESVDRTLEVTHDYEKGPCHFSGSEIYSSNPEAVARRFRMTLGIV